MPSDLHARLNAALEITPPPVCLQEIHTRAARGASREALLRRVLAVAAFAVGIAGFSLVGHRAATPAHAPQPIASATPAPTVT